MPHNFKEIKDNFTAKCKAANACQPQFKRGLSSTTLSELVEIMWDNIRWCIEHKCLVEDYWTITEIRSDDIDLRGCDLKGITLPTTIGGYLDLRGCDLKGITLPTTIGGYLYLRGCDLKGITLPKNVHVLK
jgi:hypothetical protein